MFSETNRSHLFVAVPLRKTSLKSSSGLSDLVSRSGLSISIILMAANVKRSI